MLNKKKKFTFMPSSKLQNFIIKCTLEWITYESTLQLAPKEKLKTPTTPLRPGTGRNIVLLREGDTK